MSVRLIAAAWACRGLSTAEKVVLARLAFHAADDGSQVFPSVRAVAADTSLSERAVQSALRRLEAAGLIRCIGNAAGGKPGSTRQYVLDTGLLGVEGSDKTGAAGAPVGVQQVRGRVQHVHRTGAAGAPEKSLKDKERHSLSSASLQRGSVPRSRRGRLEPIPDDWKPDEQLVAWAVGYAHEHGEVVQPEDVAESAARFRDWHAARGTHVANVNAAFRLWWHGDIERTRAKRQTRWASGDATQSAIERLREKGKDIQAYAAERFIQRFGADDTPVDVLDAQEKARGGR